MDEPHARALECAIGFQVEAASLHERSRILLDGLFQLDSISGPRQWPRLEAETAQLQGEAKDAHFDAVDALFTATDGDTGHEIIGDDYDLEGIEAMAKADMGDDRP